LPNEQQADESSGMTELLFIRHGETDWNVQQRFQGQLDVPLNATGHAQAQRMAAALTNDRHDLIFSSDLQRACQTAAPLAAAWSQQAQTLPGFREQGFGVLEGLDGTTVRAQHPALWLQWLKFDADFELPGGESTRRFHQRVNQALADLVAKHSGKRIAVVTHGGVLDMLWRSAHGLTLNGQRECDIPNTGINRLRWVDGALQVQSWAEAQHLDGLPNKA
jgi:2,3-bisphosphoglycerate-dependent phosphoglycerate mutase